MYFFFVQSVMSSALVLRFGDLLYMELQGFARVFWSFARQVKKRDCYVGIDTGREHNMSYSLSKWSSHDLLAHDVVWWGPGNLEESRVPARSCVVLLIHNNLRTYIGGCLRDALRIRDSEPCWFGCIYPMIISLFTRH